MSTKDLPSIPGYVIEKKLGQGGMASVYLATEEASGRQVALKIMSDVLGGDDVWILRFIKEAQTVAQLSHPNIIPVYDVGTWEKHFYITMETMSGGSLEDRLSEGLSIPEIVKVMVGVAAGLDFAGEKGFVHRDIKPDNVMFRADETPVILDFGIVKHKDGDNDNMTMTGTVIGTSDYMSPEQSLGKELDERSDIYSLGCMLFELLTGRPPYQGDSAVAVLMQHVNEPPPVLPPALQLFQVVIDKSMAKKVDDRYSRARDMIEHLEELSPKIKKLLEQQETLEQKALDDSDLTLARPQVNKAKHSETDPTVVSETLPDNSVRGQSAGAVRSKSTTDPEIASVLENAKATIHNYSAATQHKKVRRTKGLVAFAAVVTVFALSYVAYQQLYLVPQEMLRAERAAEARSQQKIDALLEQARLASMGLQYSDFDAVDQLVSIYHQVLRIDPENTSAQAALLHLGGEHVALAKKALADGDMPLALNYRNSAERLSPGEEDVKALRAAIADARSQATQRSMESQFQQRQIERLLAEAEEEAREVGGFSELAYSKLLQILRMDAGNTQALQQQQELKETLYAQAQKNIRDEQLAAARAKLKRLEKYDFDQNKIDLAYQDIKVAQQSLSSRQQKNALQKKKNEWLAKARRLERESRTIRVNEELRDIYSEVLRLDKSNAQARQGMLSVSDYDAAQVKTAIVEGRFAWAEQQIKMIKKTTPNHSELTDLKQSLAQAIDDHRAVEALLSEAKALMVMQKTGEQKRQALLEAYGTLRSAEKINNNHPELNASMMALENQYAETIGQLISLDDGDMVNAYFGDVTDKSWPTNRLLKLQESYLAEQAGKKKSKRVLMGGF